MVGVADPQSPERVDLPFLIHHYRNRPSSPEGLHPFVGCLLRAVGYGDELESGVFVGQSAQLEECLLGNYTG